MKTLWQPLSGSIHFWLLWGERINPDVICIYLLTVTQIHVYPAMILFGQYINYLWSRTLKNIPELFGVTAGLPSEIPCSPGSPLNPGK
jgi:hypothetical protein